MKNKTETQKYSDPKKKFRPAKISEWLKVLIEAFKRF